MILALDGYTVRTVGEEPAPPEDGSPEDGIRLFAPEVNE